MSHRVEEWLKRPGWVGLIAGPVFLLVLWLWPFKDAVWKFWMRQGPR